jgi:uridine phosphorylase
MTFPNFKNKHEQDSMFNPKDFMKYLKKIGKYPSFKVPKRVILCYSKSLMDYIIENHKVTKVEGFGEMYLLGGVDNQIAIIGKFGIGAPGAVTIPEELIAFGVKEFISIGTAGAIQKGLKIGDLIVCDRAIRDEGVSQHYIKNSKYSYSSKLMTENIKKALEKEKVKYVAGTSWTIDAPYRETVEEARQYQNEGDINCRDGTLGFIYGC